MKIEIKSHIDASVLFECEAESLKLVVELAVEKKINLHGANLIGAYLSGANLRGANLSDANLRGAYLSDANLRDANLRGANLIGAYLSDANLRGANLSDANLYGANLRGANLSDANLIGANLIGAYLIDANLIDANLIGANLSDANLSDANLRGAENLRLPTGETWEEYLTQTVPALLIAGGKKLAEVATPETWNCHAWDNCPMATAFGVHELKDIPILYRPRAEQFIAFFDAKQIPLEKVNPTKPA